MKTTDLTTTTRVFYGKTSGGSVITTRAYDLIQAVAQLDKRCDEINKIRLSLMNEPRTIVAVSEHISDLFSEKIIK
jgi:hypothetical protein